MRKPIVGFEGVYEVSDEGEVFRVAGGMGAVVGAEVKSHPHCETGYLCVSLYRNGRGVTRKVHRIVAEAFIPNPCNLPDVNHKDCNVANPNASNLEWCSKNHNMRHAYANGRCGGFLKPPRAVVGVCVDTGNALLFSSVRDTAFAGFSPQNVSHCARGVRNQHKGYRWSYVNSSASPAPLSAS